MLIPVLSRVLCWLDFGIIGTAFMPGEGRDVALKAAYLHVRQVQEGLINTTSNKFGTSHEGIADNAEARYATANVVVACGKGRSECERMVGMALEGAKRVEGGTLER